MVFFYSFQLSRLRKTIRHDGDTVSDFQGGDGATSVQNSLKGTKTHWLKALVFIGFRQKNPIKLTIVKGQRDRRKGLYVVKDTDYHHKGMWILLRI